MGIQLTETGKKKLLEGNTLAVTAEQGVVRGASI